MIIYVDIDNTICITNNTDYINAIPIYNKIQKINSLYDIGHTIVYWTARGAVSKIDYRILTENQLKQWGVKYHNLVLDKPNYDIFIDDKSISNIDDLKI